MFVQSKVLRASTRLALPLASLVEHCRVSSSPFKISAPSTTHVSVLQVKYHGCHSGAFFRPGCIAAMNAKDQSKSTPICQTVSLLHSSGKNGQLESDLANEKSKLKESVPKQARKLSLNVDEYDLDESGYLLIEELVRFLNKEGALDLCVIEASGNRRSYVDYFVVASGASTRHIKAMAKNLEQLVNNEKFIEKLLHQLQFRGHEVRGLGQSSHVVAEGLDSDHWMVVDIGNCVVHFFLPETRQVYELEKLWLLGPRYDDQYKAMLDEEEFLKATYTGKHLDSKEKDA